MILGTIITLPNLFGLIALIKKMREYKSLKKTIQAISNTQSLNVSDIIELFRLQPIETQKFVIAKGYMKAKPHREDNNIFSAILQTPINYDDPVKQSIFDRTYFTEIVKKSFWTRPHKFKNIDFDLEDLWKNASLSVPSCDRTNIFGALTQTKTFQILLQPFSNGILQALQKIYDFVLNIFPFSLLKFYRRTNLRLSYYNLQEGYFCYVVGMAKKLSNGQISIQNPQFITKQLAFVLKRLKAKLKNVKIIFSLYLVFFLTAFCYLMVWLYKSIKKRRILMENQEDKENQDGQEVKLGDQCIICFMRSREVIIKPCRHYALCFDCFDKLRKSECPVCKKQMTGYIKVIQKQTIVEKQQ